MQYILVTGGNKGIGLALCKAILKHSDQTFVFLGSRDETRGQTAAEALKAARDDWMERVSFVQLDVTRDDSVKQAADQIAGQMAGEKLYGIVNNAGIGIPEQGLAKTLDVNTYGIKRVCDQMIPILNPEGGRIVNITSASGPLFLAQCQPSRVAELTATDITWSQIEAVMQNGLNLSSQEEFQSQGFGSGSSYGFSKACSNAYTIFLANEHPNLLINACTPGYIETDLTRPIAASQGAQPRDLGMKPPEEGTKSAMHLLFNNVEGSGFYFGSDGVRSPLDRYRAPGDPPFQP